MKNLFHIAKKTFTWVTVTMAVSLFNGCSDFLDKQPLGKLNESVLTDESTVNKLLIACYSPLNGFINGVWGIMSSMEICALEISIKEVLPAIKANCYRWSVMSLLLKMVVSGINGYWYMELLSVATTYFVC